MSSIMRRRSKIISNFTPPPPEFSEAAKPGTRCLAPPDRSSSLPRTGGVRRARTGRSRFLSAVFALAALAGLVAADAHAEMGAITLTRTGANTYSFSVSNTAGSDQYLWYSTMKHGLSATAAQDCRTGVTYGANTTFTGKDQTYTGTITGDAGKYLCISGYILDNAATEWSTRQGPISYSGPTLTLNSAGADNKYVTGDHVEVTAAFGYSVDVTGTPRIGLAIGSNTRYATYNSGTGTANLKFRYTVVAADQDTDGISIAANALALNSGTIQDSGDTNAVITHSALAASANHKVNPPEADTAPAFADNASIANQSLTQNSAMTSLTLPAATGGNGTLSYSISPALPAGPDLHRQHPRAFRHPDGHLGKRHLHLYGLGRRQQHRLHRQGYHHLHHRRGGGGRHRAVLCGQRVHRQPEPDPEQRDDVADAARRHRRQRHLELFRSRPRCLRG